MPGVAYVLTAQNAPKTHPFPEELFYQGEVVAMVAAETEDLAEDAVAAIQVEYDLLPFAANLEQAMTPGAPDLGTRQRPGVVKSLDEWGDVDKAFAQSDVVKEFTYAYRRIGTRSTAAERLRRQMGRRQSDGLGHGPGHRALPSEHSQRAGNPQRKGSITSTNGTAELLAARARPLVSSIPGSPTLPK